MPMVPIRTLLATAEHAVPLSDTVVGYKLHEECGEITDLYHHVDATALNSLVAPLHDEVFGSDFEPFACLYSGKVHFHPLVLARHMTIAGSNLAVVSSALPSHLVVFVAAVSDYGVPRAVPFDRLITREFNSKIMPIGKPMRHLATLDAGYAVRDLIREVIHTQANPADVTVELGTRGRLLFEEDGDRLAVIRVTARFPAVESDAPRTSISEVSYCLRLDPDTYASTSDLRRRYSVGNNICVLRLADTTKGYDE